MINVTTLKYVDMSNLGILKLQSVFEVLPYVETIILNDNPNLAESGFATNFFARKVKRLKHLHIVNTGMENLHIYLFVSRLRGVKLKTLIVDRNIIGHIGPGIYKGLRTLEVISITYNQMSSPIDLIGELMDFTQFEIFESQSSESNCP